jgi:hypothetical protein
VVAVRHAPTLATLTEALAWAETRWANQRTATIRLHEARTTDGALGGPRFTHAFAATLDGSDDATETAKHSVSCSHPGKTGALCLMCAIYDEQGQPIVESGVYNKTVVRFRFPMTRALSQLSGCLHPPGTPHPYRTILMLANYGWDARAAADRLDLAWADAEAHFLRSLRQLHKQYQEAPMPSVSWVDKSDAQRNAEQETWTSA